MRRLQRLDQALAVAQRAIAVKGDEPAALYILGVERTIPEYRFTASIVCGSLSERQVGSYSNPKSRRRSVHARTACSGGLDMDLNGRPRRPARPAVPT